MFVCYCLFYLCVCLVGNIINFLVSYPDQSGNGMRGEVHMIMIASCVSTSCLDWLLDVAYSV